MFSKTKALIVVANQKGHLSASNVIFLLAFFLCLSNDKHWSYTFPYHLPTSELLSQPVFALKIPLHGIINNVNVFFLENAISSPGVRFSLRLYPCMSIGFPIPVTNTLTSALLLLAL